MHIKKEFVVWALLLLPAFAVAEGKKKAVKPVIRFVASGGATGEFDSAGDAFAAIQAVWNTTTQYGSRSAVNLHPWATDYYQSYNGIPSIQVTDIFRCSADGACTVEADAGPTVTALSPRCPSESVFIDGVKYGYQITDVTGNDGKARKFMCLLDTPKTEPDPKSCPVSNPVYPGTGQKVRYETDYPGIGNALRFTRTYRGDSGRFTTFLNNSLIDNSRAQVEPPCLDSTYIENTEGHPLIRYCFQQEPTNEQTVVVSTDDGRDVVFYGAFTSFLPRANQNDRILQRPASSGEIEWMLRSAEGRFDIYNSRGSLIRRVDADGKSDITFRYSDESTPIEIAPRAGLLIEVQDKFGRRLAFAYDANTKVTQSVDPAGGLYRYTYDTIGNTTSVTYPDGHVRRYLYNETANINGGAICSSNAKGLPRALTGIKDGEIRYGNFQYDCSGKVISSELAGGTNRHTFSYNGNITEITDPLGSKRQLTYATNLDYRQEVGSNQPAGSGCFATTSAVTRDANGNETSRDDFNGTRTCYTYAASRNLESSRIEGLSNTTTCATVNSANAVMPTSSRRISTQWHPEWRLETKRAEPGRITTKVYNGQPDPFSGGTASCAPAGALLPDGKPIAVLCKQVEQATTDANGALGFGAPLQAGVADRATTWTYNQFGRVLTEDGPRTDVTDITKYEYYTDTTASHALGDLKQVTNAQGKVTQYTKYNKHGQVLETKDANNVPSAYAYDGRQRLISHNAGGRVTAYSYGAVGQLKRVTLPDQTYIGYDYDDAHRLVAMYDHKGNKITYTLDNAGNKTGEHVSDPAGGLKRQLTRSIDALGRVQQTTAGKP